MKKHKALIYLLGIFIFVSLAFIAFFFYIVLDYIPERTEDNRRLCLSRVQEQYKLNWTKECAKVNDGAQCSLPKFIANELETRYSEEN